MGRARRAGGTSSELQTNSSGAHGSLESTSDVLCWLYHHQTAALPHREAQG